MTALPAHHEPPVTFALLDAFDGLFELVRREGTLDGSVPMRVAQACVPLLQGNAFGWQMRLTRPLQFDRRLGRVRLVAEEWLVRMHAGAIERLVAQGFVARDSAWYRAFHRRPWHARGGVTWLFTGLLARPRRGYWLRLSASANRRNRAFDVTACYVPDDGPFVPLLLGLEPKGEGTLRGEVATLAPFVPDVSVEQRPLEDALELAQAHAGFYDRRYFAEKRRGGLTRKYRRLLARPGAEGKQRGLLVVDAGAMGHIGWQVARASMVLGAELPHAAPSTRTGGVTSLVFGNPIAFEARFDGQALRIEHDRRALDAAAAALEQRWRAALGDAFVDEHRGAVWYLSKYFTPHPPGEPHFFVKPWAFVRTPPRWSSLLEGIHGSGYDVMRGVVATDRFHAVPAVFQLHGSEQPIAVARGAPLLELLPFPRSALEGRFVMERWLDR